MGALLVLVFCLGVTNRVVAQREEEIDPALLAQLQELDALAAEVEDLTAAFEQWRHTPLLKQPITSSGTLRALPGRSRWDTAEPFASVMVIETDRLSIYYPDDHLLEVYPLEARMGELAASPLVRLADWLELFTIRSALAEDLSEPFRQAVGVDDPDRPCVLVQLTPRDEEMAALVPELVVVIDAQTGLSRAMAWSGQEGERTEVVFRDIRPGTGPSIDTLAGYPGLVAGILPRGTLDIDNNDVNAEYHAVTLVFVEHALATRDQRTVAIDAIRAAVADVPGVTLTGMTVIGHDVELAVRTDLPLLLGVAACVIALWLGVCLRNVSDTAMALMPVTVGLLLTFAVMLVAGVGLNLLNLVALPLLAGLGIDDGVFLVAMTRDARRRGAGRAELLRELASSAQAVTLTSATTALAFGSLVLTGVPAIRSLGIVMAIGIFACWGVTLVALTPLLVRPRRLGPDSSQNTGAPS